MAPQMVAALLRRDAMEREQENASGLVELGSFSEDTRGAGGIYWETFVLQPHAGISDD